MKYSLTVFFALSLLAPWFTSSAQRPVVVIPLGDDSYQPGVPKTGQTDCYVTPLDVGSDPALMVACANSGQDGEFQRGESWPVPRFTNLGNGTIRDNLTNLIWLRNADCPAGKLTRVKALLYISDLNARLIAGDCGDVDENNDWRLPNRAELTSLLDISRAGPALPAGHPFDKVRLDYYWTSSYHSFFVGLGIGWAVHFSAGDVEARSWNMEPSFVWPVRGGG